MRIRALILCSLFVIFFLLAIPSFAQQNPECPSMVQAALEIVQSSCDETGRNEVCYGNSLLEATSQSDVTEFQFEQSGDLVKLNQLKSLQTSAMSLIDSVWGIALLKVQANLPDTLPGQNVTMLFIGDVYAENLSENPITATLKSNAGVNVRRRPSANDNNIMRSLSSGQDVTAIGKLADETWIHVMLDGQSAWIAADFLDGDISQLAVETADAGGVYGPMQAFYFRSGVHDEPCTTAPASGILVQTPQGATEIEFLINGVKVQLGSTVFFQAMADDYLYVTVLDGHASLSFEGVSQIVPAGAVGRVPLNADGFASGAPLFPGGYTRLSVRHIPLILLPEAISIARPLLEENLQQAIDTLSNVSTGTGSTSTTVVLPPDSPAAIDIANGLPPSGRWNHLYTITANTCDPTDQSPVGLQSTHYTTMVFSEDRSSIQWNLGFTDGNGHLWLFTAFRTADNEYAYTASWGSGVKGTITFTSPTTYFATNRGDFGAYNDTPACIFYVDYEGRFIGI